MDFDRADRVEAIESPRSCMSTQIVTLVRPSPTGSKFVRR
jgi:hypothetical protein